MNHLADETSPYLLQHADNPVEWYPWSPEALELARREDRPILLSIGYAACHWCHVMAHESFEDEATAALMNRLFVNIKVDREERPDLDRIYQTAHYLLTQRSGGWPLTVFLTPDDQTPFYAGTYFPPQPSHGLPGFKALLLGVAELYHQRRAEVRRQGEALKKALASTFQPQPASSAPDDAIFAKARDELAAQYDVNDGGFGAAPKFPHPTILAFLHRRWMASRRAGGEIDLKSLEMLAYTLKRMALGGVNDQLGGGFFRYSVDAHWMIPHFEKMLYDNAQLLPLYAAVGVSVGSELFRRVATETAQWVMREMQLADGGYCASLDADVEGEEGRFYLWTPEEIQPLLSDEEHLLFAGRFGLDRPANFDGRWLPHVYMEYEALEKTFSCPENEIREIVDQARSKLFAAREQRRRPARDDKRLPAWNGLMIRGMVVAGRLLDRSDFIDSAARALARIRHDHWIDGRLLASASGGRKRLPAYLDDHAFLLEAVLEMLRYRWERELLEFAIGLADAMLEHFLDDTSGAFFFTADDHEPLLERPRPFADDALPAGNAVAARMLLRLGHLLGERRYLKVASRCIQTASGAMEKSPIAHGALLAALDESLDPPLTIVVRGREAELDEWADLLRHDPDPRLDGYVVPLEAQNLPPALALKEGRDEGPVAYVCRGIQCEAPITDIEELRRRLAPKMKKG